MGISLHEVRAKSTSCAAFNSALVEDILKAAHWNNETTFTSFYLRDMSGFFPSRSITSVPFQWPKPELAIDFWNCAYCLLPDFSGFVNSFRVFS